MTDYQKQPLMDPRVFSINPDFKNEHDFSVYRIFINSINTDNENNKISTSKYTLLNFIPKILLEQFSKMANIYFLIIAVMQSIPEISISRGKPVILVPLSIVVFVNGMKDFFEDWKRKKSDDEENQRKCLILNKEKGLFDEKKWENIRLGDIVKVLDNEYFPADLLLINSQKRADEIQNNEDELGICYVETKNLDGETSLKYKQAHKDIARNYRSDKEMNMISGKIECSPPTEYIHDFDGKYYPWQDNSSWINIDKNCFLLRGSSLKQRYCIYGVAIYVGHNTKIMRNSPSARTKISKLEQIMSNQILIIFIVDLIFSFIGSLGYLIYYSKSSDNINYLHIKKDFSEIWDFLKRMGTWILIFTNLVPISLLVTMEMIKYIQGMFICWDYKLFEEETFTAAQVQTSTLNEELGQVKFIFSDKTGTLTKNYMEFKKMSIGSHSYGESNFDPEKIEKRDKYGEIRHFNFYDDKFYKHLNDEKHENYTYIKHFILCLCLCHSVFTQDTENGEIIYQASSPDETALINAARHFNYKFLRREIGNKVVLDIFGKKEEFIIIQSLEYTSERKRMTVVVKCPDDKILVYIKGADSIIRERISLNPELLKKTDNFLLNFAKDGLRTLMIAYKEISPKDYESWEKEYYEVLNSTHKNELLPIISDKIEKDFFLLGSTAIEDQLQDDVAECLESFNKTGIKVWVLTGDKVDTAKSIGFSCKLLSHEFDLLEFNEQSSYDEIKVNINDFLNKIKFGDKHKKFGLIISSEELTLITKSDLIESFYALTLKVNSVLCCRVSPKQKAEMVYLIKNRLPNSTTLAIGDGANDVNMITAAHVGVGILGVEGRQAARASDYSIAQFSYLKRLMFVHGRESYRKNAYVVCFNFYKNVLFVFPQFWFGFVSMFSGQTLYDPWIYQLFNILFTSLPIIWFGIYDKENSFSKLEKGKHHYINGIIGKSFHSKRFWKWVVYGIFQGMIICYLSYYSNQFALNKQGGLNDLWSVGSICYACIVMIVNIKLLSSTNNHTIFNFILVVSSISIYYLVLLIMSQFARFENFYDIYINFQSINYFLTVIEIVAFCTLLDIGLGKLYISFGIIKKSDEELALIEMEKLERKQMRVKSLHEKNLRPYYGSAFSFDPDHPNIFSSCKN